MLHIKPLAVAFACGAIGVAAFAAASGTVEAAPKAKAGGSCVNKAAQGTGSDEKAAKFQVDEALLQAVDWGAWASWMSNGSTPGYDFGKRTYRCKPGGIGVECVGQAKICKKAA